MESNSTLIICGTPPISTSIIEKNWGPLNSIAKKLLGNDISIQIPIPSLGAVTLATFLRSRRFAVDVRDWYFDKIDLMAYRIIGISTTHLDYLQLQNIAKIIKTNNPDSIIIIGGPLTWSYSPNKILNEIHEIDYVVNNEGEIPFLHLISMINSNGNHKNIKGISFRKDGCVFSTPKEELLETIAIARPDWSLIKYKFKIPVLPIQTARGCVYNCTFCSETGFWSKPVRFRKVESVVKEIENNITNFGITTFRFVDSCFTAPERRCIEICDGIINNFIKNGIKIKWSSYARINTLSEKLIEKLCAAGCIALDIGMESGSNSILKSMNKNYTQKNIIDGIKRLRNHNILTHCNIVVGFPGETSESIKQTVSILNAAQPDTYHCMQLYIANNTVLSKNKEYFNLHGDKLKWQHETMSSDSVGSEILKIIQTTKPSVLFIAGEYIAILLSAAGYSTDQIRNFYRRISSGNITNLDKKMINLFIIKNGSSAPSV